MKDNIARQSSKTNRKYYKNKKQSEKERYVKLVSKLDTLSPLKTLTRGYSIIEQKGKIINSVKELQEGNEIDIQMIDGKAKAKII